FDAAAPPEPLSLSLPDALPISVHEAFSFTDRETTYYLSRIGNVKSIDDLMADQRLLDYAMAAFGLDADAEPPETVRQMLEGGVRDRKSTRLNSSHVKNSYAVFC